MPEQALVTGREDKKGLSAHFQT